VLGNGYQDGLMIGCSVDRRELVNASRQASSDVGGQNTISGSSVQTLEEREFLWVCGRGLVKCSESLNDDVRVANDLSLSVQLLGCREIILLCVHESSSLEVGDCHGNSEWRVLLEGIPILGYGEFFDEGMLSLDGMAPIGAGLQDPVAICFPFVIGKFGTVKQKLMKLFVDVREAT